MTAYQVKGNVSLDSGGDVEADDVTDAVNADSGGGQFSAAGLSAATSQVQAEGGNVTLAFTAAPDSVRVDTGGGDATISAPGGPYAVTLDLAGATGWGSMPSDPRAPRSVSIRTDGGNVITNQA